MKRSVVPQRRPSAGASIALFPFLAVLVCAMGALIVILVLVARQARLEACEAAATKASQHEGELREEQEGVRWRIEQLKTSRQATEAQLAELRMQLGHLEDHSRRLRQRLAELEAARNDLDRGGSSANQRREAMEAEIRRLKLAIQDAQRRRDEAEAAASRRARSYAIVPFAGVNGTRRRPIYIECLSDAVVLQPEGIRLTVEDFEGPQGPGNPLASALRAIREYWVLHDGFNPEQSGEPYPLLLVRPEGIGAYYAAREAMNSWGSDLGYELLGEDWQISYPTKPDPELAQVVQETMRSARLRQRELIAAAPRAYGSQRQRFRAGPSGAGIVPDGGTPEPAVRGARGYPAFGSARPVGVASSGTRAGGSGPDNTESSGGGAGRGRPRDWALAGTPREQATAPSSEAVSQVSPQPGLWQPSPPPPPKIDKDKDKENDKLKPEQDRPEVKVSVPAGKLAQIRGQDWGLRDAARGAVPITRPIQVECYADRLVVLPESGMRGGKSVPLGPRTEDAIDGFVSGVWESMDNWGIAGRGMYWRPVLKVSVAPDAEQQFQDLQRLLDGSGLDVVRK